MKTNNEIAAALVRASNASWKDRKAWFAGDDGQLAKLEMEHANQQICAMMIRGGAVNGLHDLLKKLDTSPRQDIGNAVHAICPAYFKEHFEPNGWKCLD